MDRTHVIVGASLAGATAAITLRQEGGKGRVILIGAERESPYERPPLSKAYLRADMLEIAPLRPASFYAEHGIETLFGTPVTSIDPAAKTVAVDGRHISFDALLIATGVRNRRIAIPGAELAGIYSLRTVQDADRIRGEMAPGRRAVVVGLGFIGSEVAASLRHSFACSGRPSVSASRHSTTLTASAQSSRRRLRPSRGLNASAL
jgi:3-phenylpropionate/trans-cinnamate dioxygenase ferredoxin reductase subunit